MNRAQLQEVLDQVKGSTFAGLDTKTEVKLKGGKKNPHQGRVVKVTTGSNVILFANTQCNSYESMVKRRMVAEGKDPEEFQVGKRAWGTRVGNSPIIEHNDKTYLEVIFQHPGKTTYYLDGEETPKDQIEGLEVTKTADPEKEDKSQGGIENKVVIRTFSLDSIEHIRLKGQELT
ncbi:MAG: hypothetical protein WCY93_12160 [Anaerolineaceae bacterium]